MLGTLLLTISRYYNSEWEFLESTVCLDHRIFQLERLLELALLDTLRPTNSVTSHIPVMLGNCPNISLSDH